jgi:hypothetical protein
LELSLELGSYRNDLIHVIMKPQSEYNYLLSELDSLGIRRDNLHESNDINEIENLVDNIKQNYIQDYRSSYTYGEFG